MTRSRMRMTAAALALGLAFGWGTAASAQQEQFAEESLQAFAAAAVQVQEINTAAQQELQAAETPEDQLEVQAEATERMIEAVEGEGLSVDEYNEIATAAQTDPAIAQQIDEYVQDIFER